MNGTESSEEKANSRAPRRGWKNNEAKCVETLNTMRIEQSVWSVGKQRITAKTICVRLAANGRRWSGYIKGVEKPRREKPTSGSRRRRGELSEGESVV